MITKEDIKQAAFRLFALRGYGCTSMQDIAKAVGLKKQSLYSHFACKQELYEIIYKEQADIIMSELLVALESFNEKPTEELLKGMFKCLIQIFSCKERLLLWKRGFIVQGENDEIVSDPLSHWHYDTRLKDRLYEIISTRRAGLFEQLQFRAFFLSYMLAAQGYFDWMIAKGHSDDIFELYWNNIWNGIGRNIE